MNKLEKDELEIIKLSIEFRFFAALEIFHLTENAGVLLFQNVKSDKFYSTYKFDILQKRNDK